MEIKSKEIKKTEGKFNWFTMFWEGFTSMSRLSKTLWILAILELIFFYFILKPFFFPNVLDTAYDNDADKANHVRTELFEKAHENEQQ